MQAFLNSLTSDVFNLAASLYKLDVLRMQPMYNGKRRWVITELEYIIIVCRRIYDMLQELVVRIWETVQLTDSDSPKRKLPASFRKMVLSKNKSQNATQICARFNIPESLAYWYVDQSAFFLTLRSARDAIAHHPIDDPIIFIDEEGFWVSTTEPPFCDLMDWPKDVLKKNDIGPLNLFVAYCINQTLSSCETFVAAITNKLNLCLVFVRVTIFYAVTKFDGFERNKPHFER